MNKQRKIREKYATGSKVLTVFFILICLVWVMPVIEVLINSFKSNNYVNLEPFALPTEESFVGLANYIKGVNFGNYPFIKALGFSLFITVVSVALILLFCSMTAWYIVRTKSTIANIFYYLCLFSMIVPFQMVMFTLTFTATRSSSTPRGRSPSSTSASARALPSSCSPVSSSRSRWKLKRPPRSMAAAPCGRSSPSCCRC